MEQIIRCKNCVYFHEWDDGSSPNCKYWTDQWDVSTEPDGFCSFGELRLGCEAEAYEAVANARNFDAEPAKHGHWIDKEVIIPWCDDDVDIIYECSCCKIESGETSPYCPKCGAKMDLKG